MALKNEKVGTFLTYFPKRRHKNSKEKKKKKCEKNHSAATT